jgi:predicted cobalt transporter CbtA
MTGVKKEVLKMDIGQIAGLIAAIAFAVLAGFLIYPLIRLGRLFDQLADTVKETGEHAMPALDESTTTVQQVNKTLEDVNRISAAASTTAGNVGALTDLYGSMLGKPVIKVASAFFALRSTATSFFKGRRANTQYAAVPDPANLTTPGSHSDKGAK